MKAYIAIKFHPDARNRDKIEKISQILKKSGIDTSCMIRDKENWGKRKFTTKKLMQMTFKEIDKSDFIIIDLTEKGVGLGIESGYAYATKKPIIVIAEKESDISSTLAGIASEVLLYDKIEDIYKLKILKHGKVKISEN